MCSQAAPAPGDRPALSSVVGARFCRLRTQPLEKESSSQRGRIIALLSSFLQTGRTWRSATKAAKPAYLESDCHCVIHPRKVSAECSRNRFSNAHPGLRWSCCHSVYRPPMRSRKIKPSVSICSGIGRIKRRVAQVEKYRGAPGRCPPGRARAGETRDCRRVLAKSPFEAAIAEPLRTESVLWLAVKRAVTCRLRRTATGTTLPKDPSRGRTALGRMRP